MTELEAVNLGRLAEIKFRKNAEAREAALASIRQLPDRRWQVRVGGRLRGQTLTFIARGMCVTAVHDHYNLRMEEWLGAVQVRP